MNHSTLPSRIVIDGTVRCIVRDASHPNDLKNGYRKIHVSASAHSSVPVEQHSVPDTWLRDSNDRRKVTTGGHEYGKAVEP